MATENPQDIISKLEGISIENNFSKMEIERLLEDTLGELLQEYKNETLIFPMDGGFFVYYEFIKYLKRNNLPFDYSKIQFAVKDTTPQGRKVYITSVEGEGNYIIVDDIYDSGESEGLISEALGSKNVQVRAISTKCSSQSQGKTFEKSKKFEDKWIMSSLGMNSGRFKDKLEDLERLSAIAVYIEDIDKVSAWVYEDLKNYSNLLFQNQFYQGPELFTVLLLLRDISGATGISKLNKILEIHLKLTDQES